MKKIIMDKSIFLLGVILVFLIGTDRGVSAKKNVINEKELILLVDESYELYVDFDEGVEYYWDSENPDIAYVDADSGEVTGAAKGKTKVVVYIEGKKAGSCTIHVEEPKLSAEAKTLDVTDNFTLKIKGTKQNISYSSTNDKVASVSKEGIVTAISPGNTKIVLLLENPTTGKKTKYTCKIKVNNTKLIALTFDDGPSVYTPVVLDALEKHKSKATFFVLGSRVTGKAKSYIKRADELGCEIGNHTYNHINIKAKTLQYTLSDVSKTDKAVEAVIGKPTTLMRPPYGNLTTAAQKGIKKVQVLWNKDTLDWKYRNTNHVVNYVLRNASDGDIVLMHDIHKTSAYAVESIIKGLKQKGFRLVTVSELAQAKGVKLTTGKKYNGFKK